MFLNRNGFHVKYKFNFYCNPTRNLIFNHLFKYFSKLLNANWHGKKIKIDCDLLIGNLESKLFKKKPESLPCQSVDVDLQRPNLTRIRAHTASFNTFHTRYVRHVNVRELSHALSKIASRMPIAVKSIFVNNKPF